MRKKKKNKPTMQNFKFTHQVKQIFERFKNHPTKKNLKTVINAMPRWGMFQYPENITGKELIDRGVTVDSFSKPIEANVEYFEFIPKFYKVADNLYSVFEKDGSNGVAHWLLNYVEHHLNMRSPDTIQLLSRSNKDFIIMPKPKGEAYLGADAISQMQPPTGKIVNLDKSKLN